MPCSVLMQPVPEISSVTVEGVVPQSLQRFCFHPKQSHRCSLFSLMSRATFGLHKEVKLYTCVSSGDLQRRGYILSRFLSRLPPCRGGDAAARPVWRRPPAGRRR